MTARVLLSTAYLPPVEYFSAIATAGDVIIENSENYHKQTYRNRCYIRSASGLQILTVPVYEGSFRKIQIRDIRIDYSKRWQQIHLGALEASYRGAPFYEFYIDEIAKILSARFEFLTELNMALLKHLLNCLGLEKNISLSESFEIPSNDNTDLRYTLSPKHKTGYAVKKYRQLFETDGDISPRISIADLLFNMGPDALSCL